MPDIKIGWAQTSITPDRPVFHSGQIYPRVSQYVHDPVTATALALESGCSPGPFFSPWTSRAFPGSPLWIGFANNWQPNWRALIRKI